MPRFRYLLLFTLFLCIWLPGCGSDEANTTDLGEWTHEPDGISLTETLRVSDTEAFYFGEIRDVAINENERIYVADGKAHHVKILGPEGTFIDSLGTRGRGPGEFRRPEQLFFARGDSLFVLDGYYGELSSFGPERAFAYRLSLRAGQSNPIKIFSFPGEYVVYYSAPFLPDDETRKEKPIRTVSTSGTVGDTLLTVPPPQVHVEQGDGFVRFRSIPYARDPHVAGGPSGHVHYAWGDSMTVKVYDQTGSLRDSVDVPFEPVPVTEADRKRALSGRSTEGKAAVKSEIPATKPAFIHFLVDDEGRYWFGRPTAHPDSTDWWIALPDEKRVVTETLPAEVELLTVKNGRAYGRTTTEMGAPALVRYQIRTSK